MTRKIRHRPAVDDIRTPTAIVNVNAVGGRHIQASVMQSHVAFVAGWHATGCNCHRGPHTTRTILDDQAIKLMRAVDPVQKRCRSSMTDMALTHCRASMKRRAVRRVCGAACGWNGNRYVPITAERTYLHVPSCCCKTETQDSVSSPRNTYVERTSIRTCCGKHERRANRFGEDPTEQVGAN
jgi:hypothetical protein